MSLLITLALGLFILLGAGVTHWAKNEKLIEQLSIAIAFGAMTALVALDLVPEAWESLGSGKWYIIVICILLGVGVLKVIDLFIPEHDHEHGLEHDCTPENVAHIGVVSTVAVILHNVIEGMAVYSVTQQDTTAGVLMALGVGLHNIPMGMTIFATLRGESKGKQWGLLLGATLSTALGGVVMSLLSSVISEGVIGVLISLTMGMIVYIVVFELVPHLLHTPKKWISLLGALLGVSIIVLSTLL